MAGVWQGDVSNDQLTALRSGIEAKFAVERPFSTSTPTRGRRTNFKKWHANLPFSGNWFSVPSINDELDIIEKEALNKDRARTLLDRYGLIFRETDS
ncbi:MAG: ATP-dependent Lhr-like helicase [Candidatus Azotimanducaceae bacterium]|jgi:ATP-dependent Lhr-like helicase